MTVIMDRKKRTRMLLTLISRDLRKGNTTCREMDFPPVAKKAEAARPCAMMHPEMVRAGAAGDGFPGRLFPIKNNSRM
jgi:hypothetical protein